LIQTTNKGKKFALLLNSEEDLAAFLSNYKEEIRRNVKNKKDPHQVEFNIKQFNRNIKLYFSETRLTPLVDITNEFLDNLPLGKFDGKITVVESNLMGEVDRAVETLLEGKELNQLKPGEITLVRFFVILWN
jgi:hypothetical protein